MIRIVGLLGADGRRRSGAVDAAGTVRDVALALNDPALAHLDQVYADLPAVLARLAGITGDAGVVESTSFDVPLPPEASVFCAAVNFHDHTLAMAKKLGIQPESDLKALGIDPYHFLKAGRQCLVPDGAQVALPGHAQNFDWEIELAAVIGRPARNVSVADALSHVAGYTVANDLSARDRSLMKRTNVPDGSLFRTDFVGMKSWDHSCPIGPWVVPATEVTDVQSLSMRLSVNGDLRQDGNTRDMVFNVAEQIAHLSKRMTLMPGDVILTGTPAGTGAESDEFLKPGDAIVCEIEQIGTLRMQIS